MDTIAHRTGERWEFRCDRASGGWRWQRRTRDGDLVARSTRAFQTLDDAVSNALANGFTYAVAARDA